MALNGHVPTKCPLMTQSGHSQWFLTGNKLGQVATFSAEFNESTRPGRGSSLLAIVRDLLEALVTNSLWLVPISSSDLD